jgi:hypothetical protein
MALQQCDIADPANRVLIYLCLALKEGRADSAAGAAPGAVDPGLNLPDVPTVRYPKARVVLRPRRFVFRSIGRRSRWWGGRQDIRKADCNQAWRVE